MTISIFGPEITYHEILRCQDSNQIGRIRHIAPFVALPEFT